MSDHTIVTEAASGQLRHQVFPASGHSVLARAGDLVLLCQLTAGQGLLTGSLLDTVAAVAADHADGAVLSQRLTDLIDVSDVANVPSFCAFGPAGDGVDIVVHGNAELVLGAGADERRFTGRHGVTTVDHVDAMPSGPASAVIDGEELHFERQAPAVQPVTAAHVRRIIDEPEPVAEPTPSPVEGNLVLGVYCRRSHFNDPAMNYCTVCGISMAQSTRNQLLGRRPSLGVLVLDDGGMFALVNDHVFGREPAADQAVVTGSAVPVVLDDHSVSRVHARIVLEGWEVRVIDAGSTNGTFVCSPGQPEWAQVPPGTGAVLLPGMMLAFGRRQLRYYSHRAQSVDFTNPLRAKR
ncbi:MAG TPA: FHA domain-containing protein [Pseudonocardiaceae bacterium]|nr:FHA domain-containing protein [Pseudonocardiaceae bacterium]